MSTAWPWIIAGVLILVAVGAYAWWRQRRSAQGRMDDTAERGPGGAGSLAG